MAFSYGNFLNPRYRLPRVPVFPYAQPAQNPLLYHQPAPRQAAPPPFQTPFLPRGVPWRQPMPPPIGFARRPLPQRTLFGSPQTFRNY